MPTSTRRDDPAMTAAREREARYRWAHNWRSWALIAAAVFVVAGLAWVTLPKPDKPGPRVVTDAGFVAAANRTCKATINDARPPLVDPNDGGKQPTDGQVADAIDQGADKLAAIAAKLRALPVSAADQGHINGWLQGWDSYTTIGRRYADAVRSKDQKAQIELTKQGDDVQRATDRFARANGLKSCQFYIVPRGTGSDPFSGGM
jgi:hypothetical protein